MQCKEVLSKCTEIKQVVAKPCTFPLFFPSLIKMPLIYAGSLVEASANLLLAVFACGGGELCFLCIVPCHLFVLLSVRANCDWLQKHWLVGNMHPN